jgi:hypothetical protein
MKKEIRFQDTCSILIFIRSGLVVKLVVILVGLVANLVSKL